MILRKLRVTSPSKITRDRDLDKAITAEGRVSTFVTFHHYVTETTTSTTTTARTLLSVLFKKEYIYMR